MPKNTSVLPTFMDADFKRSRACDLGKPSPQCVEVANKDGIIAVRSSQDVDKIVTFTAVEWAAFIAGVKNEEFEVTPAQ